MPKFSVTILVLLIFLGLFSDIITNIRPLWCQIDGIQYFPAFRSIINRGRIDHGDPHLRPFEEAQNWHSIPEKDRIMPIVQFAGNVKSPDKSVPPFSTGSSGATHWLGTDTEGRDVLAALFAGARTALLTGAIAMLVSLLLGGSLGGIAGYYGDYGATVSRGTLFITLSGWVIWFFFEFISNKNIFSPNGLNFGQSVLFFLGCTVICIMAGRLLNKIPILSARVVLPLDLMILRLAEIFSAVPLFIILLALSAILVDRSLMKMIMLIGLISWPGIAVFLRAELLKIRQMDYITAARGLGLPEWRILWKHALPNAIRPVLLIFALGASGAVLLESGIAFLNIGNYDVNQITWGQLLQAARNNIDLWWVWVPPGITICIFAGAMFEWSERLNQQ